jgi:O-antigen/teichoic acid export membrane protein
VKNLFSVFFGTILIQALTMISGMLTARLLLPAGKGAHRHHPLADVAHDTRQFGHLGCRGVSLGVRPGEQRRQLFGTTLTIALVLALVISVTGYFLLPRLLAQHPPEMIRLAMVYLGYVPLTFIAVSAMGMLQGLQSYSAFNTVRTSVFLLEVVGVVALWGSGQANIANFVWVMLAARVGTALLAVGLLMKEIGPPHGATWNGMWDLLQYGLKVHVGTIADSLNLRLDQMLMSIFLPPRVLGLYVVSVSVAGGVSLVTTSLNIVLFPRLSSEPSDDARWRLLGQFFRLGLALSALGAIVLGGAAPWLVRWFFGKAYLPAVGMAQILILAAWVASANSMLTTAAKAFNRPGLASQAQVTGMAFTGLGLWILLPLWEGMGAAAASLLAYSAVLTHLLWAFQRCGFGPMREILVPRVSDLAEARRELVAAFRRKWTRQS